MYSWKEKNKGNEIENFIALILLKVTALVINRIVELRNHVGHFFCCNIRPSIEVGMAIPIACNMLGAMSASRPSDMVY